MKVISKFGLYSVIDQEGNIVANYKDEYTANEHLRKCQNE